ncbi:hypothetical protein PACTADRAFT_73593 [Pachysolen tannophilus NRRL Y-2460]|uniref:Uncharacterized protein n=1 Tax=Pachysolen tannophilus NRRL Y-2460 TaxID=669874 RepID=A0A1E4U1R9_PACTA|nr:hypothetical protein PACTADRAFT_73593 [Pachysolen tannophilus NRRL Y-2460]
MDFRIDVLAWDIDRTTCESRKSVLIPNSVAYWDFVKDQRTNEIQDDYMGVTFSEADNNVVLVHIKGLYSNIIKILRNNSDRGSSSSSSSSSTKSKKEEKNETRNLNKMQALATKKNSFLNGCAVANAKEYCETQFR